MQLAETSRVTSPEFPAHPERPSTWVFQRGEVLRELPGRCVYRARLGSSDGPRVVIKEFTPRRLRHWLRAYAETEADNAIAVRARGVPVVEPLAYARLADGRQILVLREEEGARDLQSLFLSGELRGGRRHLLARRVGELMARMQNAGIRHRDPHAGNILVLPDDTVLLADAWDLRPGDYLRPHERAKTLADFALFFLKHGSIVDLLLFWGEYGRTSELMPDDLEDLRQRILDLIPDAFRRLSGMRARKVRRAGRAVQVGRWNGVVMRELPDGLLEEIAERASHLQMGPHVLKKSPTAWTFVAERDEQKFVVKVYLPKKATRALRDLIQGTRADRAVEAAEAFFHRGLATAPIYAVLNDREVVGRSVLVMEFVEDAAPLDEVAPDLPVRRTRAIARDLGRTLRRMHDWGLRHRDLKRDNLLLRRDGSGFVFLDLDGVRQSRKGRVDWGRRARDLAVLDGSLLDRTAVPTGLRLRVLDAYLDGETPPGHAPGEFARIVLQHADEARARHRERLES
ncbi:MAG: lipopolysaccharide kinase InaA family protein [Planctomycetota bacterium]